MSDPSPPTPSPRPKVVIVFAGGDAVPIEVADRLPEAIAVVAADSGLDHARAWGRRVDVVVGDLDSVSAAALAEATALGTSVQRHPAEKDQTDLELALDCAVALGAEEIVLVGGHGGRVDHFLANAAVVASDRFAAVPITAHFGLQELHVVRTAVDLVGTPGEVVTLLAAGGPATGVTTAGLRYPLAGETLAVGSSRGVSNELVASAARVTVTGGTLLVIRPDPATAGR